MKIIKPSAEIILPMSGKKMLTHIERCGRVCYKSENQITSDSAAAFVRKIIERGHESVLEHASFTVRFVCDRGVAHELVRHRLASYSQESTRYCNYTKGQFGEEITVIEPCFWDEDSDLMLNWKSAMRMAETHYLGLIRQGATPQEARSVLPNSLKTEVVMTANLREWRHFFKLRTSPAAHPQMRQVVLLALEQVCNLIPVVFDDMREAAADKFHMGPTRCEG